VLSTNCVFASLTFYLLQIFHCNPAHRIKLLTMGQLAGDECDRTESFAVTSQHLTFTAACCYCHMMPCIVTSSCCLIHLALIILVTLAAGSALLTANCGEKSLMSALEASSTLNATQACFYPREGSKCAGRHWGLRTRPARNPTEWHSSRASHC